MKRFEDIAGDYYLELGLENLDELVQRIKGMQDKLKILQTAFSGTGCNHLQDVEVGDRAYEYIPIELDEFFDRLFTLERLLVDDPDYRHHDVPYRPCSFLEIGCGVGRNVALLSATSRFRFEKIAGFDVVEPYIAAARKYFDLGEQVFVQDCMTFDYGGYDILYFYRPFTDDDQQTAFEKYLVESCKVGSYIIGCLSISLEHSPRLIPKDEERSIWKRI